MKTTALFRAFLLVIFFSCTGLLAQAQDIIHLKNKEIIKGKVLEIGIDEIKYKEFSNLEGPVIVLLKSEVTLIRYENGNEFRINPDPYDTAPEVNIRNKSNALKIEFFAPLTNDVVIAFEQMLKVGTNLEFKLGVIGPGFAKNDEKASGVLFKAGVKFLTGSDYALKGQKHAHQLKGKYIKPELIFNTYSINRSYYNYPLLVAEERNIRYTNFAVNIVFGKQHILGNAVTLDYYVGLGYGIQNNNAPNDSPSDYGYDESYSYSHTYLGDNFPMIISAGLTLGFLF